MYKASEIADLLLITADKEYDEHLTNMKLQKLLYYLQGFHLAIYDERLFKEDIKKWDYGPVVPSIYHKYKQYGANAIEEIPNGVNFDFPEEKIGLLKEVFETYGQYSAWKLSEMTHDEKPWVDTKTNQSISDDLMKDYFKNYVE